MSQNVPIEGHKAIFWHHALQLHLLSSNVMQVVLRIGCFTKVGYHNISLTKGCSPITFITTFGWVWLHFHPPQALVYIQFKPVWMVKKSSGFLSANAPTACQ